MTKSRGDLAEEQASHWLQSRGLKLMESNFHCRFGEIDLIMNEGSTLVFVEVRYRKQSRFGSAAESVNYRKQQKLLTTANIYLQKKGYHDRPCRFDVLAISGSDQQQFNWIKDAFQAQ